MSPALRSEHVCTVGGGPDGAAPRTYPAGRICAQDGCTTILRRTNGGRYCCLHESAATRAAARTEVAVSRATKEHHADAAARRERVLNLLQAANGDWVRKPADVPLDHWSYALVQLKREGLIECHKGAGSRLLPAPESAPEPQATRETPDPVVTPQATTGTAETGTYRDARGALLRQPGDPRAEELIRASRDGEDGPQPSDYWPACWPRGVQTQLLEARYADPELSIMDYWLALSPRARDRVLTWMCRRDEDEGR